MLAQCLQSGILKPQQPGIDWSPGVCDTLIQPWLYCKVKCTSFIPLTSSIPENLQSRQHFWYFYPVNCPCMYSVFQLVKGEFLSGADGNIKFDHLNRSSGEEAGWKKIISDKRGHWGLRSTFLQLVLTQVWREHELWKKCSSWWHWGRNWQTNLTR